MVRYSDVVSLTFEYLLFDCWETDDGIIGCIPTYAPEETRADIRAAVEATGGTWEKVETRNRWEYYRIV